MADTSSPPAVSTKTFRSLSKVVFTICKRRSRFDPVSASETRDCQSGFDLLNALESGIHGHSGSSDLALHVSEQIARLVELIDGEFSRG
jgi:hypothetical protein